MNRCHLHHQDKTLYDENYLPPELAAEFEFARQMQEKDQQSHEPKPDKSHPTTEPESELNDPVLDLAAGVTVDHKMFRAQLAAMKDGR